MKDLEHVLFCTAFAALVQSSSAGDDEVLLAGPVSHSALTCYIVQTAQPRNHASQLNMHYQSLVAEELYRPSHTYLSIDVEDYYHYAPDGEALRAKYDLPSNLPKNLNRLLDEFSHRGARATFFVLGCVAGSLRNEIERIVAEGHELASHGYSHSAIKNQDRQQFRDDIRCAKDTLEDIGGVEVVGYRAPMFSITDQTIWALDELRAAGFSYDSSVCPVKNFAYGIPSAPEQPHLLHNGMVEVPLSITKLLGYRFMVAGGFYMRAYPTWFYHMLLRLRPSDLPAVLYLHPWEWEDKKLNLWDLGVEHPSLHQRKWLMKRIVTWNRHKAWDRFRLLMSQFHSFQPLREVLSDGPK
jgi:polysaccharide deacetylase family protein (PEP-CTERM system associated)